MWLFCLVIVFAFAYCAVQRLKFVQSFSRFPGPRAWPIIGNSLMLMGSQAEFLRLLITEGRKSSTGTLCIWVGMRPFVFLHKAEVIQPLVTSFAHTEKTFEYTLSKDWLGDGLITSKGSKWIKHRQLLTPCFHFSMLQASLDIVWKQSQEFIEQLRWQGRDIHIFPLAKRLALDLICETALGTTVEAQRNADSEYVLAIERLAEILCKRFITPILKPDIIFNSTPFGWEQKKLLKIIHGFVEKVICDRKSKPICDGNDNVDIPDMESKSMLDVNENNSLNMKSTGGRVYKARRNVALLDLLLELAQEDKTITEKDILDEVNTFMFAGHDTIASAISFTLFILGHNPEWQEKIVEEINTVCPDIFDKSPTLNIINKLDILDRCIKESLRLYPVAPLVGRTIRSPLHTPAGVLVPGTTAVINILLLHRDPQVFSEPEKFNPDRFLQQNVHINPYAYIPFSAGSRNCIGKRLALLELKIVLAMVLKKFKITSLQTEEDLQLSFEIVLFCANELKLVLNKRI